ncbi:MAG: hypothetical protein WCI89_02000 [bacterium]
MSSLFSLFGKEKGKSEKEQTVLLLDVENASVGSALVQLAPGQAPRLFAEKRLSLPVQQRLSSARMAREVERAAHEVLVHARTASGISNTAVFFGAPWVAPSWGVGKQDKIAWDFEPHVQKSIRGLVGDMPVSFHAFGAAAAHAVDAAFEHDPAFLLCVVTGEVVEILYIYENAVIARATVPFGSHTILRTLSTHAGVPLHAARSALSLIDTTPGHVHPGPEWLHEPLSVSATHFADDFADVARALYAGNLPDDASFAHSVLVVAPEPLGELFASVLANSEQVAALFPEGGTVRALRAHHLVSHASAHAAVPDLHFMVEALFANKVF